MAKQQHSPSVAPPSRLPHRLAWALACCTFPLIWVGGMVTTYRAGMAVPDWPNTFGYNLFLYPLESWLHVWDVLLEHSHRLIGAATGLVTIALLLALWRQDDRRWMRWLGVVALVAVCLQGLLGGLRVTENAVLLAKIHGCTAPVFFSLCAGMVAFTSPNWREAEAAPSQRASRLFQRLALVTFLSIYLQIVLGAQLRHPDPALSPLIFYLWVWLHVLAAVLLVVGVFGIFYMVRRLDSPLLRRRARWLVGLFLVQFSLGVATWVTHYNWPQWFTRWYGAFDYAIVAAGRLQALLTTAHVAVGSLMLVTALSLALWSLRLFYDTTNSGTP